MHGPWHAYVIDNQGRVLYVALSKSSHAALHRPSTAPILQVEIRHYACTSSTQHACPIGPEQDSVRQASRLPPNHEVTDRPADRPAFRCPTNGVQGCADVASVRNRACKIQRGDTQFCKANTSQRVAANDICFYCRI